jgi:hypothetical protein
MRVEEIALRQEARQMLQEAGLSKEELKNLVLKDIDDKVLQAIEKKIKGLDFEDMILRRVDKSLDKAIDEIVKKQVQGYFYNRPLKIHATASFEDGKGGAE